MAGQTMTLAHKGMRITVCEGQDDTVEFRVGNERVQPKAKTFAPACKEAVKFLLEQAGGMRGNYERPVER